MVRDSRRLLEVREATNTSFDNRLEYARSIIELTVKSCSEAIFAPSVEYGKNPSFSRCRILTLADIDQALLVFAVADGRFFLD
jgi:hypothetical protein